MLRFLRCLIATCVALTLVAPAAQAAVTRGWTPAGRSGAARHLHGAVRLDSGQVLVAGGFLEPSQPTRTAELFDPGTRTWSPAGSMQVPRGSVSLVKLRNGKVLSVGGIVSGLRAAPRPRPPRSTTRPRTRGRSPDRWRPGASIPQ